MNFLMFIPASLLMSMAIYYIQKRGKVPLKKWIVGITSYIVVTTLLALAVTLDGISIAQESIVLRRAEYVCAIFYFGMQTYYYIIHYKEYKLIKRNVDEFYDQEDQDILGWMFVSVLLLESLALFVPFVIFIEGWLFCVFSILFFLFISYSVVSLYSFGISKDLERVELAQRNDAVTDNNDLNEGVSLLDEGIGAEDSEDEMNGERLDEIDKNKIGEAVESWIENEGYRQKELTLGIVARQIHVPQKKLKMWLRLSHFKKLSGMTNLLRVELAKRVLTEHPEWKLEAVADYCGFNSREYFHQIFNQIVEMSPSKFQKMKLGQ